MFANDKKTKADMAALEAYKVLRMMEPQDEVPRFWSTLIALLKETKVIE